MNRIYAQDYKIEVMPDKDDKNEFLAYIPQLDCWGDGKTPSEAIKEVIDVGNDIIELAIKDGVKIPLPSPGNVYEEYSGKLTLRLPKYLHAEIAKRAEKENCSINQLIQSFVAMGIGMKYGEGKIMVNIGMNSVKLQKSVAKDKNNWLENFPKRFDKKMLMAAGR
jgi:predicted RNase H-like HicB family nuclease